MARGPRVVAELGRPETADEMAARKAESSRVYRSSQTTRNLVAALIATLVVVAVIIFAVPRGTPPADEAIDVDGIAERYAAAEGRTFVTPDLPGQWRVNLAAVQGDAPRVWTIVYAPGEEVEYIRIEQGLDADAAWPTRVLSGAEIDGTVTIDGVTWDRYDLESSRADNVSVALSTQAGADTVLVYGKAADATLEQAAASVADDVRALADETE